jgi:hypothetical protein
MVDIEFDNAFFIYGVCSLIVALKIRIICRPAAKKTDCSPMEALNLILSSVCQNFRQAHKRVYRGTGAEQSAENSPQTLRSSPIHAPKNDPLSVAPSPALPPMGPQHPRPRSPEHSPTLPSHFSAPRGEK